ncbi:DnaJ-domain-containing protein [Coniochaeta ligniaria NRRL 30616]|uniref:DnaJ-domain-containing protein n=1 Tax=Coniochaeta ligniaria NRRL 30616 TaxID=1408157 RepID=A0A1J7JAK0_9PEZI|nr:DnaJ-domain-containing protein [Coniochaeta ligniaria NRRL 30616]
MGAEQSAPRNGETQASPTTRKTCYYELLGIERQATDDEIRKAYRKKALELHPDRNLNDVENATEKFALVQTAYEILSDPQERAWYDSHRDAILSGNDDVGASDEPGQQYNVRLTSAEEIFSLMGRFSSSVPMTDAATGFFGILDAFFEQLAQEERAACEWEGQQISSDYPAFGSAKDDYDSVARPFYNVWSSFSTKKSFSWKDKYRLTEAPDRRIRRLMEKENKKFREEGIREFNDAVRSLVAFVRKRDPRYVPSKKSEAERQKVLRDSAAAQAARSRAANQEKLAESYVVPDWAQSRGDDDINAAEFSLSEEESEVEHIECVVCNKTFKSEKQYEAHEKSKKHVKAVQQLRRQMKRENDDFHLEESSAEPTVQTAASVPGDQEARTVDAEDTISGGEDRGTPSPVDTKELSDIDGAIRTSADSSADDEYAPRAEVENRLRPSDGQQANETSLEPEHIDASSVTSGIDGLTLEDVQQEGRKIGKAKAKRAKRAAKASDEAIHSCAICKEVFPSRTKLFAHIEELDHAAPVPQKAKGGKKQKR